MDTYTSSDTLLADIKEWKEICKWQAQAKEKEMELRKKLAKFLFKNFLENNGELPARTMNNTFSAGENRFAAKVVGKTNYKVLEELRETTLKEANLGERGDALLKTKYELSLTAYKALTDEERKIVDKMIESKPGAMELSIEILKKKLANK